MSGAGMRDVVPPKAFSLEAGLELLDPPRDCPLDTAADELGVTSRTDRPVVSRKLPPMPVARVLRSVCAPARNLAYHSASDSCLDIRLGSGSLSLSAGRWMVFGKLTREWLIPPSPLARGDRGVRGGVGATEEGVRVLVRLSK